MSKVNSFLSDKLVQTSTIVDICTSLTLWSKIFKFLGLTYITTSESQYLQDLAEFRSHVKDFYSMGSRTFLSCSGNTGQDETFYMHSLRYYIPKIALETFDKHKTGVGIFNMQGFERRNKESKNCLKRFSNNQGNVVTNNLKRVYDVFEHKVNAV